MAWSKLLSFTSVTAKLELLNFYSAFNLESELLRIRATITYSSIFSEVYMLQASNFIALNTFRYSDLTSNSYFESLYLNMVLGFSVHIW